MVVGAAAASERNSVMRHRDERGIDYEPLRPRHPRMSPGDTVFMVVLVAAFAIAVALSVVFLFLPNR